MLKKRDFYKTEREFREGKDRFYPKEEEIGYCPVLAVITCMLLVFQALRQEEYLKQKQARIEEAQAKRLIERIKKHFSKVKDPRVEDNQLHSFIDVIVISLCAIIAGAEGWKAFVNYGKSKREFLEQVLELKNGIPSADTFRRILSKIDPVEWQECFIEWSEALAKKDKRVVAIDGKRLKGASKALGGKAVHIVSAWISEQGLCIGQEKVEDKSNEITAIPNLLGNLCIADSIVTIDAMGCQKDIAKIIVEGKGEYLLALKKNHSNLYEAVVDLFSKEGGEETYIECEDGHGRIERRSCRVIRDIESLGELKSEWVGLASVVMVEYTSKRGEKIQKETRYYLSSLKKESAKQISKWVRHHWGIENSLHWVLDVVFKEDACRIHKGYGAQNIAVLRHLALNIFNQDKNNNDSVKGKQQCAGWNNDYMLKLLNIFAYSQ